MAACGVLEPEPPEEAQIMGQLTAHLEARLQRAVCAVTAHLETSVERRVREAHDGIAARIEDVAAAHVDRARADLAAAASRGPSSPGGEAQAAELAVARVRSECEAMQKRQDDLEAIVTRIATSTARDSAAARAEVAAELRSLGGGIRLALDRVEAELALVKRAAEEDRAAMAAGSQRVLEMVRGELAGELEDFSAWIARELETLHSRIAATSASSSGALLEPPRAWAPRQSSLRLLEPCPPQRAAASDAGSPGGADCASSGRGDGEAAEAAVAASAPCDCIEEILADDGGSPAREGLVDGRAGAGAPLSLVDAREEVDAQSECRGGGFCEGDVLLTEWGGGGFCEDIHVKPLPLHLSDVETTLPHTDSCADSQVGVSLISPDGRWRDWQAAAGSGQPLAAAGAPPRHSLPTPPLALDRLGGSRASGPVPRRSCPPVPHTGGGAVASLAGWLAEPACSPGSHPAPSRDLIRAAARELVSAAQGDELRPQLQPQQLDQAKIEVVVHDHDGDACRLGRASARLPLVHAEGDTSGVHGCTGAA
uniref:Uncharacterized protein n=1 Tax=Alexandrium monilatum TaxID=311494 RepID=A0A7S4QZV4_9DINO